MRIIFDVGGRPVPKERPRMTKTGHAYTPGRTREYEQKVREKFEKAAKAAGATVTDKPVILVLNAVFRIPESARRKTMPDKIITGQPYCHRPDMDNLDKSVRDALNGIAWEDDQQIYLTLSSKRYAKDWEGVNVAVIYEDKHWQEAIDAFDRVLAGKLRSRTGGE